MKRLMFLCMAALALAMNMCAPSSGSGIRDFAAYYAKSHRDEALANTLSKAIRSRRDIKDVGFVLDEENDYIFLKDEGTYFIRELEINRWTLSDGTVRYGVKAQDVDEEESPVLSLVFYDYEPAAGTFIPADVPGISEMIERMDLLDGNETLFMPRRGNDILWGRNNGGDPVGLYRFQPDGTFLLELFPER